MAKKIYAVKKGLCPGIYNTWEQCKAQVDGFPGAQYKGFSTLEEAKRFLAGENLEKPPAQQAAFAPNASPSDTVPGKSGTAVAYVDGSYDRATHMFSCGAVFFYNGEKKQFSQKFSDPDLADMRNVAGEIMGAVSVIAYALQEKIPALEIYYDYEGVAKWAQGEWKTNKEGTKAYAQYCREASKSLRLSFIKVKGHSGDRYNDEADLLAKQALGIGLR